MFEKVGLCHVSELPEGHSEDIESKYKTQEKFKAKILKVDEERQRISLGMKGSYFDIETQHIHDSDAPKDSDSESDDPILSETSESLIPFSKHPALAEVESRASVLPLEVTLDKEEDESSIEVEQAQSPEPLDNKKKSEKNENESKQTKKKETYERERKIRVAGERLLQKDVPRIVDDYEKMIRSSPNSSFIWIKYMAFFLSLNELVEKARSTTKRALRTIKIREEPEKLNVWVA
ncbi:unnamed protein product [Lactuca saligna]|uniref:S1 motif domain-containing protein n=1 Tax=Lactuca saligna TaxID=75948 RepID=A0AA35YJM3_LACSI|nr:unnamed protein product [Lactuca saligna]